MGKQWSHSDWWISALLVSVVTTAEAYPWGCLWTYQEPGKIMAANHTTEFQRCKCPFHLVSFTETNALTTCDKWVQDIYPMHVDCRDILSMDSIVIQCLKLLLAVEFCRKVHKLFTQSTVWKGCQRKANIHHAPAVGESCCFSNVIVRYAPFGISLVYINNLLPPKLDDLTTEAMWTLRFASKHIVVSSAVLIVHWPQNHWETLLLGSTGMGSDTISAASQMQSPVSFKPHRYLNSRALLLSASHNSQ